MAIPYFKVYLLSNFLIMMLTLHCLFTKFGQAILTNRCQIVIGCGSQVLQSDDENQSAWTRQDSQPARDTANLQ